ncbi:hypothetical protein [Haliscomenobacter sp.]
MEFTKMHWAVFGLLLVVSVALGVIVADTYLEKRYQKKLKENG